MADIVLFKSRAELAAQANLAAFIEHCRSQLTAFGTDLCFDQPCWDITGHIERKSAPTRATLIFSRQDAIAASGKRGAGYQKDVLTNPELQLRPVFMRFAQAYMRYTFALRPTESLSKRMGALRCLDSALAETSMGPVDINPHVLNRAAAIALAAYHANTASEVCTELERLTELVNALHLVSTAFSWNSPAPRSRLSKAIGPEAARAREAKMPSQAVLTAIAELFHVAKTPRDIVTTSVVGCLLAAPMRIHELLLVTSNCWIEQVTKDGKPAYGLRWRPGKNAEPAPKWLNSAMASVADTALSRVRELTENARRIAAWYEANPMQLYLPRELQCLRGKDLTAYEVGILLGSKGNALYSGRTFLTRHGLKTSARDYSVKDGSGTIPFADAERAFLKMLPVGFPWASKALGLRYSDLLFVIELNGLSGTKGTCPVMFQPISRPVVARDLADPITSIFSRHMLLDENGNPLRMTSHQARHLLNTIALIGGMTQLDVAKWSGRKNVHQNDVYDHRTPAQMLEHIRDSVGDRSRFRGPLATLPKNVPITRREFALQHVPTAHVTEAGWCIHDYTESPCEIFNDCMNCLDQVCIKGERSKNEATRDTLSIEEGLLQKARAARADEEYGAEMWEQHHAGRVLKLRELVAIYDDPSVPDGTVIQLAGPTSALPDLRQGSALASPRVE